MAVWHLTVDLSSPWSDDSLTFEEKVEKIAGIVKNSGWRDLTDDADEFDSLVDELSETLNAVEFDFAFGDLYDLADRDRVWIETS